MLVERYCMLVFSSFDRGARPTRAKAPAKLYDFAFLICYFVCKFSNSCLSKYYSILLQLTIIRQAILRHFSALYQIYDIVSALYQISGNFKLGFFFIFGPTFGPNSCTDYWFVFFYIVQGSGPLTTCYFLLIFWTKPHFN